MPLFGVALEIVSDKGYNLNYYFFNKAILIIRCDVLDFWNEQQTKIYQMWRVLFSNDN